VVRTGLISSGFWTRRAGHWGPNQRDECPHAEGKCNAAQQMGGEALGKEKPKSGAAYPQRKAARDQEEEDVPLGAKA